jgi:hypothetical protein
MSLPIETAEQYTPGERLRFAAMGTAAGLLAVLFGKFLFFPWLHGFADSAPCRTVLGIDALRVLWYGLFVGIPAVGAMVVGATLGRRGLGILREGQVPLRREKVFRPTRIQRGKRATLAGWLHVLAFAPFAMLALWGFGQAAGLSRQVQATPTLCAADHPRPTPRHGPA